MKIISTEMGRIAQFFVPDEVRPVKGIYLPEHFRLISERYGFGVIPNVPETLRTGAKFQQGRLVAGNRSINIAELAIHNDGIVVTTTLHTDEAEFVLQDFWAWAKLALGARDPVTPKLKLYESHLVVDFDANLDDSLHAFSLVRTELQAALKDTYNHDSPVSFNRITFSIDPISALPPVRTELWIERRLGVPYSQNRYFCACGLTTDRHIKLLETFEEAAKGRK